MITHSMHQVYQSVLEVQEKRLAPCESCPGCKLTSCRLVEHTVSQTAQANKVVREWTMENGEYRQ